MSPRRLPNGNLEIEARFDGPNGEIGDALIEIGPDDERFPIWDQYLTQQETPQAIDRPS